MSDVFDYVNSGKALQIIRDLGERPTANRQLLKLMVDAGKIRSVPVHSNCYLYRKSDVVAAAIAKRGHWGKP